ncbi:hypothetical protein [Xenorhabdus sp. KK7.4]|nr:hypothetical protein Xekk_00899 [Xenorhabdus sp. KK7.4]
MRTGAVWVIGISVVFQAVYLLAVLAHASHRFYKYTVTYAPGD